MYGKLIFSEPIHICFQLKRIPRNKHSLIFYPTLINIFVSRISILSKESRNVYYYKGILNIVTLKITPTLCG